MVKISLSISALALFLALSGCHKSDDPEPEPVDHSPKPKIEFLGPVSGDSPLKVPVRLTATDGDNDISKYELHIGTTDNLYSNVIIMDAPATSIDTVLTLYHNNGALDVSHPHDVFGVYYIYGEVFDKQGNSSKTGRTDIRVKMVRDDWEGNIPMPKGRAYLFATVNPDDEYNKFKTKLERDNFIENARANDITPTILTGLDILVGGVSYKWACANIADLFTINSLDLGKNPYFSPTTKIYDWYMGDNIDSIYVHGGTLKYAGSHRAPIFAAHVSVNHSLNYAVTGDDLRDGKSINFIEAMYNISKTNVEFDGIIYHRDYDDLTLHYAYHFINYNDDNELGAFPAVKYDLVDGKLIFKGTNPNIEVPLTRDEAKKD
ncbi:MAG: hypothetical protein GT598_06355 [Bacteroidales bacterium]|nr:hypothetical protein [Bacteroidales bacterium]